MGSALFIVNLNIKSTKNTGMGDRFFELIYNTYIQPRSVFVYTTGSDIASVIGGSIVDPYKTGSNKSLTLFDEECECDETGYTKLLKKYNNEKPQLDIKAMLSGIDKIRKSAELEEGSGQRFKELCIKFWGDTKVYYIDKHRCIQCGYMLRQKHINNNEYVPLVEITTSEELLDKNEFNIRIVTWSNIWSKYTSKYDCVLDKWTEKQDNTVEYNNIAIISDLLCKYLKEYKSAEVSWEYDQSHYPPLGDLLVLELQKRLGAPTNTHKVSNMPFMNNQNVNQY